LTRERNTIWLIANTNSGAKWVRPASPGSAHGSYPKNATEMSTASPQSTMRARMRRPMRPMERGPDSGSPRRSPGHLCSDGAAAGVAGILQSYKAEGGCAAGPSGAVLPRGETWRKHSRHGDEIGGG